jgi:hypothetical protein
MNHNRTKRFTKRQQQAKNAGPLGFVFAGLILVLMASLALFRPISAALNDAFSNGSPSLKVNQEKVDLGDVKLGKSVSVSFQLTNTGNKTLRFSQEPYIETIKGC